MRLIKQRGRLTIVKLFFCEADSSSCSENFHRVNQLYYGILLLTLPSSHPMALSAVDGQFTSREVPE